MQVSLRQRLRPATTSCARSRRSARPASPPAGRGSRPTPRASCGCAGTAGVRGAADGQHDRKRPPTARTPIRAKPIAPVSSQFRSGWKLLATWASRSRNIHAGTAPAATRPITPSTRSPRRLGKGGAAALGDVVDTLWRVTGVSHTAHATDRCQRLTPIHLGHHHATARSRSESPLKSPTATEAIARDGDRKLVGARSSRPRRRAGSRRCRSPGSRPRGRGRSRR